MESKGVKVVSKNGFLHLATEDDVLLTKQTSLKIINDLDNKDRVTVSVDFTFTLDEFKIHGLNSEIESKVTIDWETVLKSAKVRER